MKRDRKYRRFSIATSRSHPVCFSIADFSILLPCAGNSGIAQFGISLMIETLKGKPLNGTPLRLSLRKECTVRGESVSRAHDHHLFTRTYSSVSAVIHRLICCMLLTDAVRERQSGIGRISIGSGSLPRLRSRGCCIAARKTRPRNPVRAWFIRSDWLSSFLFNRQPWHVPDARMSARFDTL